MLREFLRRGRRPKARGRHCGRPRGVPDCAVARCGSLPGTACATGSFGGEYADRLLDSDRARSIRARV